MPNRGLMMIAATGLLLGGCANDGAAVRSDLTLVQPARLGAGAVARDLDADLERASKQTVSAKMLAAIALQRVTGRTADPTRFRELR